MSNPKQPDLRLGKAAGLWMIFKLVVYGIQPFGDKQWDRPTRVPSTLFVRAEE